MGFVNLWYISQRHTKYVNSHWNRSFEQVGRDMWGIDRIFSLNIMWNMSFFSIKDGRYVCKSLKQLKKPNNALQSLTTLSTYTFFHY